MMSLIEAKNKILAQNPDMKIIEGFEFDDIFAFGLVDKTVDENALTGSGYDVIDKSSGKIYGMSSVQIIFREGGTKISRNELN